MSNKTVFVIGAGASAEANLPTGFELKQKISNLLDIHWDFGRQQSGDFIICDALFEYERKLENSNGDITPFINEALHIRDALPPLAISIDNFIDAHRDNPKIALCGKLAIARAILNAEKNSSLFGKDGHGINFDSIAGTWYLPFFQLITENCSVADLEKRFEQLILIIFNYDRCIEHFLFHALKHYYRIKDSEAAALIGKISIYHPYGSVGTLPWLKAGTGVKFGAEVNCSQLLCLSQQIKTFTEGTDPGSSEITAIRSHMIEANRIAFLGFAFHQLNMQLIAPAKTAQGWRRCFATAFNISESDQTMIKNQIKNIYNTHINMEMVNSKCVGFFNEFWRSLAF